VQLRSFKTLFELALDVQVMLLEGMAPLQELIGLGVIRPSVFAGSAVFAVPAVFGRR
jgi:hypothetical protein